MFEPPEFVPAIAGNRFRIDGSGALDNALHHRATSQCKASRSLRELKVHLLSNGSIGSSIASLDHHTDNFHVKKLEV